MGVKVVSRVCKCSEAAAASQSGGEHDAGLMCLKSLLKRVQSYLRSQCAHVER